MACKVGHKLGAEEFWQHIRTNGGNEIDEPGGVWPDLHMSWTPIYTKDCTLCGDRTEQGEAPFCTWNCPTQALMYGDLADPQSNISLHMQELLGKGFRIFQAKSWEGSREGIIYAQKG